MSHDTAIAAFDSHTDAQAAVNSLVTAGIPNSHIQMQPSSATT